MTKRIGLSLATTITSVILSWSALAADMSRPPPPAMPMYVAPVYNWSGLYVGANLGGAWASGTLSDSFTGGSISASRSGFIGGGELGYNFQWGNFVLGAEWDFDWTSLNSSGSAGNLTATAKTNWVDTLAARFGWAFNNWLWYGKAGGGWVNNQATLTNVTTGAQVTGSNTNSGWLLGTGIEYGITPNWTVKLEYDYLGLNTWNTNSTVFAPSADRFSVSRNIQTLMFGVNYKFW